jgi:hypothetical protein
MPVLPVPTPTHGKIATSLPPPQVNTATQFLSAAFNPTGPGTPGSPFLTGGNTSGQNSMSSNFNQLSAYAYLIATYGGGAFGVLQGLAPTTFDGLNLTFAAGQALVGGIAELSVGGVITLPDNTSNIWIWLKAGVQPALGATLLQAVATSTTPPTGQWTLIGNATTSGGVVTAIDLSGVVYLANGLPARTTADTGAPGDSPNVASRILTYTQGGSYQWDGTAHRQLTPASVLSMSASGAQFGGHTSQSFNVQALTATLMLTVADANIQQLSCTTGQTVALPANAVASFGQSFQIFNSAGSGGSLTLKDSTLTTTIATIAAGYMVSAFPINSSGSPVWPSSLTPVAV